MWFDKIAYLQTLPIELEKMFIEKGWDKTLFFRIRDGLSKFIDVRLFESLGSDGQRRRFGVANSYDTSKSDFTDSRFISADSPLGRLGTGDGTKTKFQTAVYPFIESSLILYVNGVVRDKSSYTVDSRTGNVTFKEVIPKNTKITYECRLANDAYEPCNDMIFFTFSQYFIEKELKLTDKESDLGNGNGTKTEFKLPFPNFDESRVVFYRNKEIISPSEYDFSDKSITFKQAPASSDNIKMAGIYTIDPSTDKTIDTITAKKAFDTENMESIMNEVYSAINFVNPSPYTPISFTPENRFTRDWKRDSVVYMYGNANKDRIIMFMRIDPTPAPVRALFVPLYIGRIYTFENQPRRNMVVLAGCRPGDQFNYSSNKKVGNAILDYGDNTSNGNETIQLSQSYTGAMYQQHYLSFITHNTDIDNGQGRFNPSVYSGKYHLSQIYIVHPNDGYVGKLDDVYAVHPKNIQQADELEIEKTITSEVIGKGDGMRRVFHLEHKPKSDGDSLKLFRSCIEVSNEEYVYSAEEKTIEFHEPPAIDSEILANYEMAQLYRYTLPTTPISPFTQKKSAPFTPIGLAIYKEDI
ncbi:hypothetical protein [Bacillus paranthracis]|uniref:hypothetical protein n=1 Tax=Bacillus paranthracis TaxID=2026186 RepID=UPI003D6468AE